MLFNEFYLNGNHRRAEIEREVAKLRLLRALKAEREADGERPRDGVIARWTVWKQLLARS
jgi:hypothetical protein